MNFHAQVPYPVNAVSMTTGNGTGTWRVGFLEGKLLYIYMPPCFIYI